MYQVGEVVKVKNPWTSNQVGGTVKIHGTVHAKIVKKWEDWETGTRYIGELFEDADVDLSREAGKTTFTPEHYKKDSEEMYLEVKAKWDAYDPKKVYFGQFDELSKRA